VLNRVYELHLGFFTLSVGSSVGTLTSIAVGFIILFSIHYRSNIWFRFMNLPVCNYLGKLSYSLYLWQQLFTLSGISAITTPPLSLLYIFAAANFSYYLVEKPFLRLKTRFETRTHADPSKGRKLSTVDPIIKTQAV
jgi:peptidoglycan/LPS O-acetylase OafA/YrhL